MDKIREEIEKLVFGYLDLSERAQDPGELVDKITSLIALTEPVAEVPCSVGLEGHWRKAESGNYPLVSELTCQSDDVLVQCSNDEMFIVFLDGTCADITWLDYESDRIFDVIAWQPLPKPMAA